MYIFLVNVNDILSGEVSPLIFLFLQHRNANVVQRLGTDLRDVIGLHLQISEITLLVGPQSIAITGRSVRATH